ncbi:MAG: hypothetical protein U0169_17605 [Polyangiaceae bacterium]
MNKIAFFVAALALFGLSGAVLRFGAVSGALVMVALTVAFAVAASGEFLALAVAGGALGAFAADVLAGTSPFASGAILVAACFAERTTRVRGKHARIVHVGAALLGGGIAGALSAAFGDRTITVHAVATIVSAVLVALPLLIEADDPVAHTLDLAATEIGGPIEATLREGAELRRHTDPHVLDRAEAKRVNKTWSSLLRLTESRMKLARSTHRGFRADAKPAAPAPADTTAAPTAPAVPAVPAESESPASGVVPSADVNEAKPISPALAVMAMLDQRIREHVAALSRAYTAGSTARAAAVGVDDAALKNVETVGESLENVSRALLEVK